MVVVRDHAKAKPDSQILLSLLGLFIFGIYAFEIFRWFIKSRLGKYDSDFYEAEDLKINDYPPPLILLAGALAAFLAIHLFIETFFR